MTDEDRHAITLSAMEGWKKRSTLKEHQVNLTIKPEELELEFLTILMRLICIQLRLSRAVTSWISVDFVYKQLLDGHKPCNTTLSLTQYAFSEISLETRIKLYLSCDC